MVTTFSILLVLSNVRVMQATVQADMDSRITTLKDTTVDQEGQIDQLEDMSNDLETENWYLNEELTKIIHNGKDEYAELAGHVERLRNALLLDDNEQGLEELRKTCARRWGELEQQVSSLESIVVQLKGLQSAETCEELWEAGRSEGFIQLWIDGVYQGPAMCDGPWLVIQRRQNGGVDFNRNWDDYRNGFGNPKNDYWMGLEPVRQLTSQGKWRLRVDLKDKEGNSAFVTYKDFRLGPEDSFYTLQIGRHIDGTAGDPMIPGQRFSTKDKDNDQHRLHCAQLYHGAWWYRYCDMSYLNGEYGNDAFGQGVNWYTWKGSGHSLPFAQMKMMRVRAVRV